MEVVKKLTSKKDRILDFLEKNPGTTMKVLLRNFPRLNVGYLTKLRSQWNTGYFDKKRGSKKKRKKSIKSIKKKTKKTTSPPPKDDVGDLLKLLPKSIQALLSLGPTLKNIPAWLGPTIIDEIKQISVSALPGWTRPTILHPIQNEAIDAILYNPTIKVVMIDGEKRLGKSWIGWIAACEAQFNNRGMKRWFLYGATEKNASLILEALKTDPLIYDNCRPWMDGIGSALKVKFHGTGSIRVMASGSERQTSGTDTDVIWVDESHSVLIENPKTIAMSAMVLRAQKNLKILYTMNREGDAYEYFKDEMLQNFPPEQIAHFSFTSENCPHIDAVTDVAVRTIVRASAGPEYEAQYMDNLYIRKGGLYYPASKIQEAYKPYKAPHMELYDAMGAGVDWGDNHDTAIHVGGIRDTIFYEEEMIYIQHPTPNELIRIFTRLRRDYPGIIFIWETSPLGAFARNAIREAFPKQRFLNSSFTKRKQAYVDNFYIWLMDMDIHLKNQKLKLQLRGYCGDKKNDDGHDALIHLLYLLAPARTKMKIEVKPVLRN